MRLEVNEKFNVLNYSKITKIWRKYVKNCCPCQRHTPTPERGDSRMMPTYIDDGVQDLDVVDFSLEELHGRHVTLGRGLGGWGGFLGGLNLHGGAWLCQENNFKMS